MDFVASQCELGILLDVNICFVNEGLKLSALEPLLNKKFDWDKAVRNVLGSKVSFKSVGI